MMRTYHRWPWPGFTVAQVVEATRRFDIGERPTLISGEIGVPKTNVQGLEKKYRDGRYVVEENGSVTIDGQTFTSELEPPLPTPYTNDCPTPPSRQYASYHEDSKDMEVAALQLRIRELEERLGPKIDQPSVHQHGGRRLTVDEMWKNATDQFEATVNHSLFQNRAVADLPKRTFAIVFQGDLHISPGTVVDTRRMLADAALILDTPDTYVMMGGDLVDNHIVIAQAILAQRSQPGDQYRLASDYIQRLKPRLLGVIGGNHDEWTVEKAGIDMLSWICDDLHVPYAPDEMFVKIPMLGYTYTVGIRHKPRLSSSFNEQHAPRQWIRNDSPVCPDVAVMCHHHTPYCGTWWYRERTIVTARPGAYQLLTAYSRKNAHRPCKPGMPTVVFCPEERCIIGFEDLRHALPTIRSLREGTTKWKELIDDFHDRERRYADGWSEKSDTL